MQKGAGEDLLREKDLDLPEYEKLAEEVKEICDRYQVLFTVIPTESGGKTGARGLHLPLSVFREDWKTGDWPQR